MTTYLRANVLDHFDTDKGVKCVFKFRWNVAVVKEVDANAILQAGFPDTLVRQSLLFYGQRESVHLNAVCACGLVNNK